MPRAFVGLWILDRDAARKDYAKLAQAATRGAEDDNPIEVIEVQAEEWVTRAVGSDKQLMLQKRDKDAAWEEALLVACLSIRASKWNTVIEFYRILEIFPQICPGSTGQIILSFEGLKCTLPAASSVYDTGA
jgi:hypothetical protein